MSTLQADDDVRADEVESSEEKSVKSGLTIRSIIVKGNKHIGNDALIAKMPYVEGGTFDPSKTGEAIRNIYSLGYFENIKIEKQTLPNKFIDLYVIVSEKKLFEKAEFKGNKALKYLKINERLKLDARQTISQHDINDMVFELKRLYEEHGYLFPKISAKLIVNAQSSDKARVVFTIKEGPKSYVLRINFKGNKKIPERKLRATILTQERWPLSFLNRAGKYHSEMVDVDKRLIEKFYNDNGYLMAKVSRVEPHYSSDKTEMALTYVIDEGEQFIVRSIGAPGDDIFLESELLPHVDLKVGEPYSVTKVMKSVEKLKELWGEKGYINADVYPQVKPDEKTNEVDVSFLAEHGNKVYVNRIDITGNDITKDKVIRRKLALQEGDLITLKKLQESSDAVEHLSFFDRGGVNWRMHRIDENTADLEMSVKETKTGQFNVNASTGSNERSNKTNLRLGVNLEKRNFMGEGWDVGFNSQMQLAKNGSQYFEGHFLDPHLFDSNISGRVAAFHKKQEFDSWVNVSASPELHESGGHVTFGFMIPKFDRYFEFSVDNGWEWVQSKKIIARGGSGSENAALQTILNRTFISDGHAWVGLNAIKDTRNHMVYPNRGYKLCFHSKIAPPPLNSSYAYVKGEIEMSYYTRIIGEDSLVLMLRGLLGSVHQIGNRKDIPYKEFFHVGGQASVRGFKFGEIGPLWKNKDPLGAREAIIINAELIFPVLPDYSVKAHLFYDAGAGWNTSKRGCPRTDLFTKNSFDFRQAVGFGINLMSPQPIKIDWGYKLDRRPGESPHEVHFSANFAL
jgi:outer membrane protein insertion porin family